MKYTNNDNILYRKFQGDVDAMMDAIDSVYPYPENDGEADNTPKNTEQLYDLLIEIHNLIITNW